MSRLNYTKEFPVGKVFAPYYTNLEFKVTKIIGTRRFEAKTAGGLEKTFDAKELLDKTLKAGSYARVKVDMPIVDVVKVNEIKFNGFISICTCECINGVIYYFSEEELEVL